MLHASSPPPTTLAPLRARLSRSSLHDPRRKAAGYRKVRPGRSTWAGTRPEWVKLGAIFPESLQPLDKAGCFAIRAAPGLQVCAAPTHASAPGRLALAGGDDPSLLCGACAFGLHVLLIFMRVRHANLDACIVCWRHGGGGTGCGEGGGEGEQLGGSGDGEGGAVAWVGDNGGGGGRRVRMESVAGSRALCRRALTIVRVGRAPSLACRWRRRRGFRGSGTQLGGGGAGGNGSLGGSSRRRLPPSVLQQLGCSWP